MNTGSTFALYLYLGWISPFCIKFIITVFHGFTVNLDAQKNSQHFKIDVDLA